MPQQWTVGELAHQAGVSVRTLDHYDAIGLVSPSRTAVGHRRYVEDDVARLAQVVALRSVGLSLGQVQHCLDGGEPLLDTLERQLRGLTVQVARTTVLRDRLAQVVAQLGAGVSFGTAELLTLIGDTMVLAEGKTKIIEDAGGGEVFVRSKDDITAADGVRHDVLVGKAVASTRTTSNVFRLLERNGIPTHYRAAVDEVTFRARNVAMIPVELVARRYACGSFSNRFPEIVQGTVLDPLVVELFEKDDARHDPLLRFDFDRGTLQRLVPNEQAARALGPEVRAGDLLDEETLEGSRFAMMTPELLERLRDLTAATFEVIERAWRQQGGVYLDAKIECGFDRGTGHLVVADVIDSDSGRLHLGEVDMSKQSYRDGTSTLPEIGRRFDEVAALTDRFLD